MPSLQVDTASVTEAGTSLSPGTDEMLNQVSVISGLSGAADGTPASGAFEDLLDQWVTVLPQMADANAMIAATLLNVAASYEESDATVATGAGGN